MDNIFIPKNLRIGGNKNLDEYVKGIEKKREAKEEEERKAKEAAEQQKAEPKIIIPGKQRIVPLLDKDGKVIKAAWLEARDLVKDKGGLPSNVLHDDVFVYSDAWKSLCEQNYYPWLHIQIRQVAALSYVFRELLFWVQIFVVLLILLLSFPLLLLILSFSLYP